MSREAPCHWHCRQVLRHTTATNLQHGMSSPPLFAALLSTSATTQRLTSLSSMAPSQHTVAQTCTCLPPLPHRRTATICLNPHLAADDRWATCYKLASEVGLEPGKHQVNNSPAPVVSCYKVMLRVQRHALSRLVSQADTPAPPPPTSQNTQCDMDEHGRAAALWHAAIRIAPCAMRHAVVAPGAAALHIGQGTTSTQVGDPAGLHIWHVCYARVAEDVS